MNELIFFHHIMIKRHTLLFEICKGILQISVETEAAALDTNQDVEKACKDECSHELPDDTNMCIHHCKVPFKNFYLKI